MDKLSENYKEYIEKVPYLKTGLFWLSIVIIFCGGYGTVSSIIQKKRFEVYAAPSEIKLGHQRNKKFTLKVTNNQDFAIYDANLGICTNNKDLDLRLISLDPVKEVEIPGVPFSMFRIDLGNSCCCIVLGGINAHSTNEYYVRIQGEKVKRDSLISFVIHDWGKEPSLFDIPTTKGQFSDPPKKFEDFFSEESEKEPKTGRAYFQKFKTPTNPYFNN